MRDDEGRPLGESRAPPEQRGGVPLELRTCPYADSRQDNTRPMNASALGQMLAHWEQVRGGVALLRSLGGAGAARLRLVDTWRVGLLSGALANFAFLRTWAPFGDGELPAAVAALYKALLGIPFSVGAMWADGAARLDAIVGADVLYDYADRHGHFIGREQVCAGPVAMVKEVLGLLVEGVGPPGDPSAVAAAVGDARRFLRFAHAAAALHLLRMAHDRLDAGMGFELAAALAVDPAAPALPEAVRQSMRVARFLRLDAGARPDVLDELLAHAADPGFAAADLGPGAAAIRAAWARPLGDGGAPVRRLVAACPRARPLHPRTREALGGHLARFREVERAFAAAVRLLKGHAADALGVELTHPRARELYLVDYVPAGLRLTRGLLRDVLDVEVRGEGGRLVLACGGETCESPAYGEGPGSAGETTEGGLSEDEASGEEGSGRDGAAPGGGCEGKIVATVPPGG
jgi:hypothetical protein